MTWHAINLDLWAPMWPNVFAPSFWTLMGIGMSHAHQVRILTRHHDEHMKALQGGDSK